MPIKLTGTLEGYLIIKITKVKSGLHIRDNVHSRLRHAKRPMAVRGGGGAGRFEQWPLSVDEVGFLF